MVEAVLLKVRTRMSSTEMHMCPNSGYRWFCPDESAGLYPPARFTVRLGVFGPACGMTLNDRGRCHRCSNHGQNPVA